MALAVAILGWSLWRGMRALALARDIADTPLSRLRSVAQGYVAVQGCTHWMPGPPIYSPLTGTPCVWWSYSVARGHGKERRVVEHATSDDCFHLEDAGGRCIVDPVGAAVEPQRSRTWRGSGQRPDRIPAPGWDALFTFGDYTYHERFIERDAIVYARGWYRTQRAVAVSTENDDLRALLVRWKQDRKALLARFDTDHNGVIDAAEWDRARAAALEDVRARRFDLPPPADCDIIAAPADHRPYVISGRRRDQLVRHWRLRGLAWLATALVAGVFIALSLGTGSLA